MIRLASIIFIILISFNAHARNPGESAQNCVNASAKGDAVTFKNNCGEKIFVIWCGELKYSKKRCGDGPKGGFYTHSFNMEAGAKRDETIMKGAWWYAACKGGISFGNDGEYKDYPDGSVECLKR